MEAASPEAFNTKVVRTLIGPQIGGEVEYG